jgi:hypothetical protein
MKLIATRADKYDDLRRDGSATGCAMQRHARAGIAGL